MRVLTTRAYHLDGVTHMWYPFMFNLSLCGLYLKPKKVRQVHRGDNPSDRPPLFPYRYTRCKVCHTPENLRKYDSKKFLESRSSLEKIVDEFVLEVECEAELADGSWCAFKGEVTSWENRLNRTWGFTCPSCGAEHEEDLVDPDEYDTLEEFWLDNE